MGNWAGQGRWRKWWSKDRGILRPILHAVGLADNAPKPSALGNTPAPWGGETGAASQAQGNAWGQHAQQEALNRLNQVSRTGMTDADAGMQASALRRSQQATAAQRQAAVQQAQARGLGPQAGLLGALAGSQADANAASEFAAQSAFNAQGRADRATSAMGALGGQMDANTFNQQFMRGTAADQFNWTAQTALTEEARDQQARQDRQNAALLQAVMSAVSYGGGGGGGGR